MIDSGNRSPASGLASPVVATPAARIDGDGNGGEQLVDELVALRQRVGVL